MRPTGLVLRIMTLGVVLLVFLLLLGTASAPASWRRTWPGVTRAVIPAPPPTVAPAPAQGPTQAGVHQVIIDGHCQLVDAQGVPLYDSLYWQRTGHDPC